MDSQSHKDQGTLSKRGPDNDMFKLSNFKHREKKIENHKTKSLCHLYWTVPKQSVHFQQEFSQKECDGIFKILNKIMVRQEYYSC